MRKTPKKFKSSNKTRISPNKSNSNSTRSELNKLSNDSPKPPSPIVSIPASIKIRTRMPDLVQNIPSKSVTENDMVSKSPNKIKTSNKVRISLNKNKPDPTRPELNNQSRDLPEPPHPTIRIPAHIKIRTVKHDPDSNNPNKPATEYILKDKR